METTTIYKIAFAWTLTAVIVAIVLIKDSIGIRLPQIDWCGISRLARITIYTALFVGVVVYLAS